MCEPHLNLLALAPQLLEALGASKRPGNVPGVLMTDIVAKVFLVALPVWVRSRLSYGPLTEGQAASLAGKSENRKYSRQLGSRTPV